MLALTLVKEDSGYATGPHSHQANITFDYSICESIPNLSITELQLTLSPAKIFE